MMKDQKIAVWFSCGAASAVAAKVTLDTYGKDNDIHILNNPILEEGEDNQRFLRDVQDWLDRTCKICQVSQRFCKRSMG